MRSSVGRAFCGAAIAVLLAACTLGINGTLAPDDDGGVVVADAGVGPPAPDAADDPATTVDPLADAIAAAPDRAPPPPAPGCDPQAIVLDVMGTGSSKNSGPVGTAGPACVRYAGNVMGWGVSNGQGRMVEVIGATTIGPFDATLPMPSAMAPGPDGYIYWALTAGDVTYTSVYVY